MGTGGNGIFKTSNGGLDWSIMNNGLTDLTVTRLLIDHTDHTLMYAGTYGGGVFKSEDGGQSWAQANNGLEDTFVYSLALSPSRNGDNRILSFLKDQVKHITGNGGSIYIYAGVYGGKIYRSEVKENLEWDPF
jgi:photosystem II stability/assembly factor-like uncharacterized protein